jgi:hypothetical protein
VRETVLELEAEGTPILLDQHTESLEGPIVGIQENFSESTDLRVLSRERREGEQTCAVLSHPSLQCTSTPDFSISSFSATVTAAARILREWSSHSEASILLKKRESSPPSKEDP